MKRLNKYIIFFFGIFVGGFASASELNWSVSQVEKKSEVSLAFEMAKLDVENESISSYGARIAYDYNIWKRLDVESFLASTLSTSDGLKPGSTTLGLYAMYNLFDSMRFQKSVSVGGESVITEKSRIENQVRFGLGFEQCFLSGDKGVYSVAGTGFQVNYAHNFMGAMIMVGGRLVTLYSGDIEVKATMVNVGWLFDF